MILHDRLIDPITCFRSLSMKLYFSQTLQPAVSTGRGYQVTLRHKGPRAPKHETDVLSCRFCLWLDGVFISGRWDADVFGPSPFLNDCWVTFMTFYISFCFYDIANDVHLSF